MSKRTLGEYMFDIQFIQLEFFTLYLVKGIKQRNSKKKFIIYYGKDTMVIGVPRIHSEERFGRIIGQEF